MLSLKADPPHVKPLSAGESAESIKRRTVAVAWSDFWNVSWNSAQDTPPKSATTPDADTLPVRFTEGEAAHTIRRRLSCRDSDSPNLFSREFPCCVEIAQLA